MSKFSAYLKGRLRVELRDIRQDRATGKHYAMIAPVLLDEASGEVICELEAQAVRVGQGLVTPGSIALVPVEGRLDDGRSAGPAPAPSGS